MKVFIPVSVNDELWRPVPNFEGSYEVSNTGKVRSLERIVVSTNNRRMGYKSVILKHAISKDGYCYINLQHSPKCKTYTVHRLVALVFIDNPENKPDINHKNSIKTDNNVENLEWVTKCENIQHSFYTGLHKIRHGGDNKSAKKVVQLTMDGLFIKEWDAIITAEREGGFSAINIGKCCNLKNKSHKGYKWIYSKDYLSSTQILTPCKQST